MDYVIEIKKIAPVRVLTTKEQVSYENLSKEVSAILKVAGLYKTDNHITLVYQPELKLQAMTKPCCPVSTSFSPVEEKYMFDSLERVEAVSAIHRGEYENFDETMEKLAEYIKKHNLKTSTPIRVIHHRGGQVYKLFKPKSKSYVAEVQIPIVQEAN